MQQSQTPRSHWTRGGKRSVSLPTAIGAGLLITIIAFVGGLRAQALNLPWLNGATDQRTLNLSSLQQVYNTLQSKFAEGSVSSDQAVDGALHGLVVAAGDPYTTYFNPEEAKTFSDDLNGTFTGIGAELAIKDKNLVIQSILDDSPAKKAGLMTGDIIIKVNDQDTTGWAVDKAVAQIRGDKGTTVKLQIVQAGVARELTITRDSINNPSVKSNIEPGNIGYMQITRFADNDTTLLSRRAAENFKTHNVKGVVLDLRGNGGGYVTAAQSVASLWLGDGKTVVTERKGDKVIDEIKSQGDPVLQGVPTVVLIDGGSASASEIVAGALHDSKAAQLVGAKSFGKGSVQDIISLPNGGELKVTIALWYTPAGKNINKQGIAPDVAVPLSNEDASAGRDPQKAKAIEILARRE